MLLVFKHLKDFILICNVVHFPEKVTCSYIRYVILIRSLSLVMFVGWKDVLIPLLLLGRRHNPRRKGGLSMLCGKDDIASEHTLVWAAFMLFSSLPQRALCMHYCLNFMKSLQWLSMVWVYRGKQMNGSIQYIFLSPSLIKLYLL